MTADEIAMNALTKIFMNYEKMYFESWGYGLEAPNTNSSDNIIATYENTLSSMKGKTLVENISIAEGISKYWSGPIGVWMSCVKTMAAWYVENIHDYNQSAWTECELVNNGKVRHDCSGFVSACLQLMGILKPNEVYCSADYVNTESKVAEILKASSFFSMEYSEESVQPFDIIANPKEGNIPGHVEIFAGKINGKSKSYAWGSLHDAANGGLPCGTAPKPYKTIWRCMGLFGAMGNLGNLTMSFETHMEYQAEYSSMEGIDLNKHLSTAHVGEFIEMLKSCMEEGCPANVIVALGGCSVQECGGNIHVINKTEFDGQGSKGTGGWAAGESVCGYTFYNFKMQIIAMYNKKYPKCQQLPSTVDTYSQGRPKAASYGYAYSDNGKHICDLNAYDQGKLTYLFVAGACGGANLVSKLGSINNLPTLVAELFLRKAGFDRNSGDRLADAYASGEKYKNFNKRKYNSYLECLKYAELFIRQYGSNFGGTAS